MSAWILLRGLARESRHWAQLPERLRASGLQSEVVGVDLPGSGRYVQARAPANIPETTAFLRARLAEQGYEPPYCVVALSLGGMVGVDPCIQIGLQAIGACLGRDADRTPLGRTRSRS